jgi:hypothetical protein
VENKENVVDDDVRMPDPDELVVARVEAEPLLGPQPDADPVAPPTSPGLEPGHEPEPVTVPGTESTTEVEEDGEPITTTVDKDEPEPDDWKAKWNKSQQKDDEDDARKGMGKADLKAENERLKAEVAAARRAPAPTMTPPVFESSEFVRLPEKDEFDESIPANIAINAQQAQMQLLIKQSQQLVETQAAIDAQLAANANHSAFLEIIDMACEGNESIRNDLINGVKQTWAERGYDVNYYPNPEHTVDAVDAVAQRLINKRLREEKAAPPAKKKQVIKTDTATGGRRPGTPTTHVIEPDFHKAIKRMTAAGAFKDVTGG